MAVDLGITGVWLIGRPGANAKDFGMGIRVLSRLFAIAVAVACWYHFYTAQGAIAAANSIETIITDMQPPHAALPHGVPQSYDWLAGPRLKLGNHPGAYRAMTAWGQLYEAAAGNPAWNSRVQIRNLKTYMLSRRTQKWKVLQASRAVTGAAYREDFLNDINQPAKIRHEADGSISVRAEKGYNFHFWPSGGRVWIDPDDVDGLFTTVQARLILDQPTQIDDRSRATFVLNVGADYWVNLTSYKYGSRQLADEVGMGKFKVVTSDWQSFNMITLSEADVRKHPPPLH